MTAFYKCEITGSLSHQVFSCYTEVYYKEDNTSSEYEASLKAENKLIRYFDENLSMSFGEIDSINIMQIKPEEYYGMKKTSNTIYI